MTKSLMWLLDGMLADASIRCGTDTRRDALTASRRVKHEGLSFLTITLPKFCQDFEKSLDQGFIGTTFFPSFRKNGRIPAFLRGIVSQVFDPGCGKLLTVPSEEAILTVRQLCLAFKKVNLPCSEERTKEAYRAYSKCELELAESSDPEWISSFQTVSDIIVSEVLSFSDLAVREGRLLPRHGPGATAEKISGNQKFNLRTWHTRLEVHFPFTSFGLPSLNALETEDSLNRVEFHEPDTEQPVRVISVPKTLSAPRLIAIEPVCMQYIQQALSESIVSSIEGHPLTAGHINFHDQTVNRKLAQDSSKTGRFATIDLSEASDRVHRDLVFRMFRSVPNLRDAIFSCRSTRASLVDGTTIPLTKFASMGSALCFPVESLLFYITSILGVIRASSLPLTRRSVVNAMSSVYVYGDDLIIAVDKVPAVITHLEGVNLKVNSRKTFFTGKFRESCGMDAYDGVDVTPVYVRQMPPCNRQSVPELVSYVSLANQLYHKGWWVTAKRVREFVEKILGELPHVLETSPCLGWNSFLKTYSVHGWDSNLHRPLVKGYVVRPKEKPDPLQGWGALMKCFLKRGLMPILGRHLERTVRPGSASIKYRWAQPF